LVEQTFMESYGHENVKERVYVPAENHRIELDELERAVEETTPLLAATPPRTP
jgi:hypothetical protein